MEHLNQHFCVALEQAWRKCVCSLSHLRIYKQAKPPLYAAITADYVCLLRLMFQKSFLIEGMRLCSQIFCPYLWSSSASRKNDKNKSKSKACSH